MSLRKLRSYDRFLRKLGTTPVNAVAQESTSLRDKRRIATTAQAHVDFRAQHHREGQRYGIATYDREVRREYEAGMGP